jgi:RNA polymerase sigma factor (sigma-70 family)
VDSLPDSHWFLERLELWRSGDLAAGDELLRVLVARMQQIAHRMLRHFPNVRAEADTPDVVQGAALRLVNGLRKLQPVSSRDFINLAAAHIRRELLDLARHFGRKKRTASLEPIDDDNEPAAPDAAIEDLELWAGFHAAVEQLPDAEREVFGFVFYHGWTQLQVAKQLEVSERTVRRLWAAASAHLYEKLGGRLPAVGE